MKPKRYEWLTDTRDVRPLGCPPPGLVQSAFCSICIHNTIIIIFLFIQSFKWDNDGFNLKCCSFPSFNVFILNGVQSTNLMCKPSESCHQLSAVQLHHLMQLYHLSKKPSAPYTVLHPLAAGSRNQLSILQNFFVKDWCRFCILFAFLLLLQFTLPRLIWGVSSRDSCSLWCTCSWSYWLPSR